MLSASHYLPPHQTTHHPPHCLIHSLNPPPPRHRVSLFSPDSPFSIWGGGSWGGHQAGGLTLSSWHPLPTSFPDQTQGPPSLPCLSPGRSRAWAWTDSGLGGWSHGVGTSPGGIALVILRREGSQSGHTSGASAALLPWRKSKVNTTISPGSPQPLPASGLRYSREEIDIQQGPKVGPGRLRPGPRGSKPPLQHQPSSAPPTSSGDTFAAGKVNPLQFKGSFPRWQ